LSGLNKRRHYSERLTKISIGEFILAVKFVFINLLYLQQHHLQTNLWHLHRIAIVTYYRGDCDAGFGGERS